MDLNRRGILWAIFAAIGGNWSLFRSRNKKLDPWDKKRKRAWAKVRQILEADPEWNSNSEDRF